MVKEQKTQDRYILRFEQPGQSERLKTMAGLAKRSLNKQILVLIEEGEASLSKDQREPKA